jgi:hypothetical protein
MNFRADDSHENSSLLLKQLICLYNMSEYSFLKLYVESEIYELNFNTI